MIYGLYPEDKYHLTKWTVYSEHSKKDQKIKRTERFSNEEDAKIYACRLGANGVCPNIRPPIH